MVGADGLHSIVRHLTFGEESRFRRYLGGYLAVYTVPNRLQLHGRMLTYLTSGRLAATYPVWQTGQARAAFLFRHPREFDAHHRDIDRQKRLLRDVYADHGGEVRRLLADLDHAEDFYFDSISQIVMQRWRRGRRAACYTPWSTMRAGRYRAIAVAARK